MSEVKFFSHYSRPESPRIKATGGLTQQHFRDECDLNVILKRYRVGDLPAPPPATYADLTEMPKDLASAFDKVAEVQDWFDALPSETRQRYDNDPRIALRVIATDLPSAVKNGLLPPPASSEPILAKTAEAVPPEPQKKSGIASAASVETGDQENPSAS